MSKKSKIWMSLCALSVAAATSDLLVAQTPRGSIRVRVLDQAEAVVPGANVSIVNTATNTEATGTSDENGTYTALYLTPGDYTVSVEAGGFKRLVRRNVTLNVSDQLALELLLEVGGATEAVTVTAAAAALQTETAAFGQVIDQRRVAELPLPDGNPFTLVRLAPGTYTNQALRNDRPFDNQGTSNVSTNGAPGPTEFTLDGAPNTGAGTAFGSTFVAYIPPADAVQEFKVETNSFDAQNGHTAGALVNVALKSGTNDFNGSAYYFIRNDALNANDFFLNRAGQPRPPFKYDRFGGSVGGPVYLPRFGEGGPTVYSGRDRTFFFFAYEGLYDTIPNVATFTVPTPAQRAGNFSALLPLGIRIYDPATARRLPDGRVQRDPFPGNIIPANRLNPVARNILNFFPLPNQPGDAQGRNNYIDDQPNTDDFASLNARVDHRISGRQNVFVRYSFNDRTAEQFNYTENTGGVPATGQFLIRKNNAVTLDHVINLTTNSVLNYRLSASQFQELRPTLSEGRFDPASLGFGPRASALFGGASYFPTVIIGNFASLGLVGNLANSGVGPRNYFNVYSFEPTVSQILAGGQHQLKYGYDFRVYQENFTQPGDLAGQYNFGTDFTRGPFNNSAAAPIGQELASFLLGLPTGGEIDRNATRSSQTRYHGFFVQDDWKVTRGLSLNLGLRYGLEQPTTERYNRNIRGFDATAASPVEAAARAAYARSPIPEIAAGAFAVRGGLLFADENNRGFFNPDKNNFEPRVGVAYQLDDRSVLRGGFGVYTAPFNISAVSQPGFSLSTNLIPSTDVGLTFVADLANPFPGGVNQPPGASLGLATFIGRPLTIFNLDRKNARALRFQASYQRELPGGYVVEAAYVGNRSYDIIVPYNINAIPAQYLSTSAERDQARINVLTANVANPFSGLAPGTALNNATAQRQQLLRPFPQFLDITGERNDGSSTYHSAQLLAQKRFARGYTFQAAYTFSRLRDRTVLLNPTDEDFVEQLSFSDRPHRLALSGIFELPFGRGRRFGKDFGGITQLLLGGYQVQGVYQYQSGTPVAFFANYIFRGDPNDVRVSGGSQTPENYFNTAGFERAAGAQLAFNLRAAPTQFPGVRNPAVNNVDLSILKNIEFTESVRLQLRGEAINAFNTPFFNGPDTNPTSSNFGRVTSQGNLPRFLQLGLRLVF